ncbi:hypothetical protein AB0K00_25295 [Dactylosporangium sp. NPDC049525]
MTLPGSRRHLPELGGLPPRRIRCVRGAAGTHAPPAPNKDRPLYSC